MSTHQQAQAGDHARIIQIFGDNNIGDNSPVTQIQGSGNTVS